MRRFYTNANILLRKFSKCSSEVKRMLFKSYCSSMYCSQFWFDSSKSALESLRIAFNNSLRRLMNLSKYNSASEMCVYLDIKSFGEMMRNNIYDFIQRLQESNNCIITSFLNSTVPITSHIWCWWRSMLHIWCLISFIPNAFPRIYRLGTPAFGIIIH